MKIVGGGGGNLEESDAQKLQKKKIFQKTATSLICSAFLSVLEAILTFCDHVLNPDLWRIAIEAAT